MDLRRIYSEFIADRRTREGSLAVSDRHHVLPKCIGGTDDSANLVRLSPSDHLFAHVLLGRIHGGELMLTVVLMMDHERYRGRRSRLRYQQLRDRLRVRLSEKATRQWTDPAHREAVSQSAFAQWSDPARRERMQSSMSGNKNALGAVRSPSTRARVSQSWTPERRAAQAERNRLRASINV